MGPRYGWATAAIALLTLACASPDEPAPGTGEVSTEIVGGNAEAGHPAVGAMTFEVQGQYGGSFCSGTLIAPRWVLTAAHCTEGIAQQGIPDRPENIFFYIGTDARPVGRNQRPDGDFYQASDIFLHPSYTGADLVGLYDIALIRLVDEVEGVDPYPALTEGGEDLAGDDMLYVGFGVSNGNRQSGGGVKRSTSLEVDAVYNTMYVSNHDGSGVCFGDSGGPGLVQIGGQWRVFGVNSSVAGEPLCLNQSLQTRVDTYDSWIRDTMGEGPNCRAGGADACLCADACQGDGVCDNSLCGTSCDETANCVSRCRNQACFTECLLNGSSTGVRLYGDVISCGQARCSNAADYNACVNQQCEGELQACFANEPVDPPDPGDQLSCVEVLECLQDCNDQQCGLGCYNRGSRAAQSGYNALAECASTICGNFEDPEAYNGCMVANCSDEWLACVPSEGCRATGGDCPRGEACVPGQWGGTYCEEAGDAGPGDDCDPEALSCRDGAFCVPSPQGGACAPTCAGDGDCDDGAVCELFGTPEPFGVCLGGMPPMCIDDDDDGSCADDDCDDDDAATYPGADEICGDGDDQDCDGLNDEGCPDPGCTDRDEDGTCAEDDCDDADPDSYPGARELCGDFIDQDCDGPSDEGCDPGCADNDNDGVCQDEDCNDADPGRRPGLEEICGDAIDQDCDGSADEGCPECEDADEDGVCAELDCADDDPTAYPGAGEQCGNGVDEDCDDRTDEGCEGCTDADEDGFCAAADCDDSDPSVGGPGPDGCDGGCIDADGDGICLEVDCDDADPTAGAAPCITVIDEDGGVGGNGGGGGNDGDGDGDGGGGTVGCYCEVGSQGSAGWETLLLLAGLLGWRRRRRA